MELEIFTRLAILSSLAVVVVQEILKLKIVPVTFANRYPVFTNILLSITSSIIAVWQSKVVLNSWTDWVLQTATVSVVAAIVYNNTLKHSPEIKSLEG